MIYLDTSVALAHLLAEDRHTSNALWRVPLVSSRLLEYELWNRINARGLAATHEEPLRDLVGRVALVELARPVLARAIEPFPAPVRTFDALIWPQSSSCARKDRRSSSRPTTSGWSPRPRR